MRIYVPILEIHQEKAGIKWGLSKKKQFSTIYESYKPILGFPTIFKTKTVASIRCFDLLMCPFPMCCLLHPVQSFQLQTLFLAHIPNCRCLIPIPCGETQSQYLPWLCCPTGPEAETWSRDRKTWESVLEPRRDGSFTFSK